MRVEDLVEVERDLDRTPRAHREERGSDLVAEWIALATERAAVRCCDHADARARQAEDFLELAVQVMGDLRRGPQGELVVGLVRRDRAVRLDRRVGVALEEEPIVADVIGRGESALQVAEGEMDLLENVR